MRMAKMEFKTIEKVSINDLLLDIHNPRLDEQPDEKACIKAILNGNEQEILNLARDIAEKGLYPEAIIVSRHPDMPKKWVVRDGNRRITAIKLLHDPSKATPALRPKLESIIKTSSNFPSKLTVTTCDNEDEILRFLHLKHTGKNEGVGQVEWGAIAKAIYSEKTGERNSNIKALNLLRWAKENGIFEFDDEFPISTLADRLMSKERLLQIGFELNGDNVTLVKDPVSTLNKVKQIIADLRDKTEYSRSLNGAEEQKRYVDSLCAKYGDGDLKVDTAAQSASVQVSGGTSNVKPQSQNNEEQGGKSAESSIKTPTIKTVSVPPNRQDRNKLFNKSKVSFRIPLSETKASRILSEIHSLNVKDNPIATAMLLRTLIEYATNYYILTKVPNFPKEDFVPRIRKTAEHMFSEQKISQEQLELIKKYTLNEGSILHMTTLHKYVHSTHFHPEHQTLNAFWDEIEFYVRECWSC